MNINSFKLVCAGLLCFLLTGCEKESGITPSAITGLKAETSPGQITLRWDTPDDGSIFYTKVSYYDKLLKKEVTRLASAYSDSILIPNTRKKYGTYTFMVQPFSHTETGGKIETIEMDSEAAPATVSEKSKQIELTADDLTSNAQEPSGGPASNLLDNDQSTFFHTAWTVSIAAPHWLQVNLKKELTGYYKFYYAPRNNTNNKPTNFDLMGSTDGTNWFLIKNFTKEEDGLPSNAKDDYTSPSLPVTQPFSFVRIVVNETNNKTVFWTMSELKFYDVTRTVIDPEAPDEETE